RWEGSIEKKLIYDEKGNRKLEDAPQLAPPRLDLIEPSKFGSIKMIDKLPSRRHLLIGRTSPLNRIMPNVVINVKAYADCHTKPVMPKYWVVKMSRKTYLSSRTLGHQQAVGYCSCNDYINANVGCRRGTAVIMPRRCRCCQRAGDGLQEAAGGVYRGQTASRLGGLTAGSDVVDEGEAGVEWMARGSSGQWQG
ncbi:hypothetical protein ACLOJK_004020, partial [Asimina triloba]